MRVFKYFFIGFIFFALIAQNAFASNASTINSGIDYLKSQQQADGHVDGFSGVSDWTSQAISGNGIDISTVQISGGTSLLDYLKANPPISSSSSTDWSRRILTVTAANQNPYDFEGINLVSGLETYYNNNQIGNTTAVNDDMFGLIALLASKVDSEDQIISDTASFIISNQHIDGGFSYSTDSSTGSDIDDSSAALMTLVLAKNQGVNVNGLDNAINNAKNYVLSHQNQDGGFAYDPNPATSWDTSSNVSTTSWVAMALSALDMNNNSEFSDAIDYIISTQQPDGSFPYQPSFPPGDTFDTSFALLALENSFWPIHIYSGVVPTITIAPTNTPTPTSTPSQSSSSDSNSPTNTPTPTPTNTPTPTLAAKKQAVLGKIQLSLTPTEIPTLTPIPTTEVLGTQTNNIEKIKKGQNYFLPASIFFFSLGVLLALFQIGKILWLRKNPRQ